MRKSYKRQVTRGGGAMFGRDPGTLPTIPPQHLFLTVNSLMMNLFTTVCRCSYMNEFIKSRDQSMKQNILQCVRVICR